MENFEEIVNRARQRKRERQDGRLENFVALLKAGAELQFPQLFPSAESCEEGDLEKSF